MKSRRISYYISYNCEEYFCINKPPCNLNDIQKNIFFKSLYINKIERKKEKHIWYAKVMYKLLKKDKKYRYDGTGKNPQYTERTMPHDIMESEETRVRNVYFRMKELNEVITGRNCHAGIAPKKVISLCCLYVLLAFY